MSRRRLYLVGLAAMLACDRNTPAEPPSSASEPNRPPVAAVRVNGHGPEGTFADLSAEGSRDPDGDSLFYTWDFGDGTTLTGTYQRQLHRYLDNGTYVIVLTVTDTHGATAQARTSQSIENMPPYITAALLSTPQLPAQVPMTATVHQEFGDDGINDNPIATIDWGDGTVSPDTTHVYRKPGVYDVTGTVTDKDGASTTRPVTWGLWVYDSKDVHSIAGYDVIDLGTLGGNRTFPYGLNNRGEVVGSSATAGDTAHAFLWRNGSLTDLSSPGLEVSSAVAINDEGLVAGASRGAQMPIWRDGVLSGFVAVPPAELGAAPVRITAAGDVLLNIEEHEWPRAVLVRNGGVPIVFDGIHSWAHDMTTDDRAVGAVATKYIGNLAYEFHAFLWQDGAQRDLGGLASQPCRDDPAVLCTWSEAFDINEHGQIVGWATDGKFYRAVIWNANDLVPHDLGFGESTSRAVAINENGQIAGDSYEAGEGFFRDGETVIRLGSLGGGKTRVVAMNEHGVVVGTSVTASGDVHAFVWTQASGMRDLGPGPYPAPGVGTVAVAINDRGDILGYEVPCASNYQGRCSAWNPVKAVLWHATTATAAR